MDSLPDTPRTGVSEARCARVKEAMLSWGAHLDRLEAWRRSEGWEDVPAPTRRGVLAVLEYAHAMVRGMGMIGDPDSDPARHDIELSYLKRVHDHAYLLYDVGMDRWEDATGSRDVPEPPPALPQFPEPIRAEVRETAGGGGRPRHDDRAGIVYLLRSDLGHYKIGHTRNLKNRRANFGITLPFGFEILHTIPSEKRLAAEQQLHARFADRRNNGEWFDLTDEDVAYIKSLTEL